MKYCPFCGAVLPGGAVPFCAKCGKRLPVPQKSSHPDRMAYNLPRTETLRTNARKPGKSKTPQRNPAVKNTGTDRLRSEPCRLKPDPRDEGYDGYYNDVKPIDDGRVRDRIDSELVKRIVMLAAGAFCIVIIAVILMSVL